MADESVDDFAFMSFFDSGVADGNGFRLSSGDSDNNCFTGAPDTTSTVWCANKKCGLSCSNCCGIGSF